MPGFPPLPANQWNVTDQNIMSLLQLMTLEPDTAGATWPSGMWTQAEIVQYINDVQRDFLSRSGITCAISFFTGLSGQARYNLDQSIIDLRRIAWRQGPAGTSYVELARVDNWEMDFGTDGWDQQSSDVPSRYMTDLTPSLTVQVQPTPDDIGEAELTAITLGTSVDGSGIDLSVPDDWTPYIDWGVLAKMFSKEGEAQDPDRAEYCSSRYEEGIALGRLLVEGVV